MTRPTRPHKPHASHVGGEANLPLDYDTELRRLLRAYAECPGIVADLTVLLAQLADRRNDGA